MPAARRSRRCAEVLTSCGRCRSVLWVADYGLSALSCGPRPVYASSKSPRDSAMDQTIGLKTLDRQRAIQRLTQFVAASFDSARVSEAPFYRLQFDRVFPDDVYAAML